MREKCAHDDEGGQAGVPLDCLRLKCRGGLWNSTGALELHRGGLDVFALDEAVICLVQPDRVVLDHQRVGRLVIRKHLTFVAFPWPLERTRQLLPHPIHTWLHIALQIRVELLHVAAFSPL